MAPLLRRRLTCFYCSQRSSKVRSQGLRQWECEHCDVVNYLDQNGDITDPPASKTPNAVRYAQTIERASSPVYTPAEDDLFCPTCVKNQLLLTQSLASYLPPTTDPDYATYEASYPAYRKRLEERYPQVCPDCEPRVNERIRQAGYLAKTDHLRRMVEKSRGGVIHRDTWSWRLPIVYAGSAGWWTSWTWQFMWNALGTLARPDNGLRDPSVVFFSDCLRQIVQEGHTEPVCVAEGEYMAVASLVLGFICIWWNPRLSYKIKGRKGRVVGWAEYYKLQIINLSARLAALYMLGDFGGFQLDHKIKTAGHAVVMVFTLVAPLASYRAIRIDDTPLNPFLDKSESPPNNTINRSQGSSFGSRAQPSSTAVRSATIQQQPSLDQRFPINSLAAPQPRYAAPYRLPTPPPDDREDDAMDWTPSRAAFEPIQRAPKHQQMPVEPSPFHGTLPPAPMSQAHRLRNPPQPNFTAASSARKQNFFERMSKGSPRATQHDSDEGPSTPRRPVMADQRFFPTTEQKADTGLENLFTAAFSLKDEPSEVRALRELEAAKAARQQDWAANQAIWPRLLSTTLTTIACFAWSTAPKYLHFAQFLRLSALGVAAVVAGMSFLEAVSMQKDSRRYSSILIYAIQVTIATLFGSALNSSFSDTASPLSSFGLYNNLGNLPIYFLAFMFFQELLTLVTIATRKLSTTRLPLPPGDGGSSPSANSDSPVHPMFATTPSPPNKKKTGILSETSQNQPPPKFFAAPTPIPMEPAIDSPALSFSSIASAPTASLMASITRSAKTPNTRSRTIRPENFTPSSGLSALSLGGARGLQETPPAGTRLSGGGDGAWWENAGVNGAVGNSRLGRGAGGRKSKGSGSQWGL